MLERLRLSSTHRPCDVIMYWSEKDHLLLSPPYQRGLVWGQKRKVNLIRSLLLGVPIPSIVVNDRFAARWGDEIAVIDGKQRITTLLEWFRGQLAVPGEWFDMPGEVRFTELSIPRQRGLRCHAIPFCEAQLPSLEAEREVFDLINFGGVPQGESDIVAGEGWFILPPGTPLQEGDGFLEPATGVWVDFACRPDLFKGSGAPDTWYQVPSNDTAHTWPWRRKLQPAEDSKL